MRASTTNEPSFYEATSVELANQLPGEYILTPWELLVTGRVTAYNGLTHKDMREAFASLEPPVEGKFCVTPIRAGSNLNVAGKDSSGAPQLASLSLVLASDPEREVSLPELARGIAYAKGDPEPRGKGVREYLMNTLHNHFVFDPQCLARFIPNPRDPLPGRRERIKFTVASVEELRKFKNRVGVGEYIPNGIPAMSRQDTWILLLDQIALAVGAKDHRALADDFEKFREAKQRYPLLTAFLDDQ